MGLRWKSKPLLNEAAERGGLALIVGGQRRAEVPRSGRTSPFPATMKLLRRAEPGDEFSPRNHAD